jgi:hypothetical protein
MSDNELQEAAQEITRLHNEIATDAAKAGMTVDDFLELCLKGVQKQGSNGVG